jgi:hypothetical protein
MAELNKLDEERPLSYANVFAVESVAVFELGL